MSAKKPLSSQQQNNTLFNYFKRTTASASTPSGIENSKLPGPAGDGGRDSGPPEAKKPNLDGSGRGGQVLGISSSTPPTRRRPSKPQSTKSPPEKAAADERKKKRIMMASDDDEDDISDLRNRTRTNDQLSGDEAESTAIKNKAKKENSTPKAISKRGDLGNSAKSSEMGGLGKRKRKRIMMLSDDDDDEDIDKDDDVADQDYKAKDEASSDSSSVEEDDDEDDEECMESLEAIKKRAKSKAASIKLERGNSTPKVIRTSSGVSDRVVGKLVQFSSPSSVRGDSPAAPTDRTDRGCSSKGDGESSGLPHLRYKFLDPAHIMDSQKRRPDHPDYDGATLHVPESFLKDQTPCQYQWWKLKAQHFDTILFFKLGKFYELLHMDAVVGVEKCGLTYMGAKGYAHCGFPEIGFQKYVEMFVDFGYKVARVEQTETPAMMESRCKTMNRATKFDKVVRREICQITSGGTRLANMGSELCYLTAICAVTKARGPDDSEPLKFRVGVCFVDASVGTFNLAEFSDDSCLSKLETMLSLYPPSEILYDRQRTTPPAVLRLIEKHSGLRRAASATNFPTGKKTLKHVSDSDSFETGGSLDKLPEEFRVHLDPDDRLALTPKADSELALSAFGAVVAYLEKSLIEQYVLTVKRVVNVEAIDLDRMVREQELSLPKGARMILDSKTVRNLDLVAPAIGAAESRAQGITYNSLFAVLDRTRTAMGKRLLKHWVCAPLLRVADIKDRQDSIRWLRADHRGHRAVLDKLKSELKGIPDLEKLVTSIHASGVKVRGDHPENRAVYFEQSVYSGKKIAQLVNCLGAFAALNRLFEGVQDPVAQPEEGSVCPRTLSDHLLFEDQGGIVPKMDEALAFFNKAFDRKKAVADGKIQPKPGVDEDFDRSQEMRAALEEDVARYLREQRKHFRAEVKYFGSGNNAYQLEVPEQAAVSKVDHRYTMSGTQKKGFRRYITDETKEFLARKAAVEEAEATALAEVNRSIFLKFGNKRDVWDRVVQAVAVVDAILSLYEYSYASLEEASSCFPEVVEPSTKVRPFLRVAGGRHAIVIAANPAGSFIPNDFQLDQHLAILTGANMGGKSTLMRQTAILCVLAQMGCRVPAVEMALTPVDRIFTRIGASDNIFEQESTFFVELAETSVILKHANIHSLVLVDELGRGTTTFDGCAIAHAVSKYLTKIKCRTIFSTHYHELTREYLQNDEVNIYHMSIMEEADDNSIVFLYTVSAGPCSKSHGFNAARLAGLPDGIIRVGQSVADKFEEEQKDLLELASLLQAVH